MNEEILERKIVDYVSTVMLPKMPNGLGKFLGYMGIGAIANDPKKLLEPYMDMARKVCIIDDSGIVDLGKLEHSLMYAFDNVPSVHYAGFTFTKADVSSFMAFIGA